MGKLLRLFAVATTLALLGVGQAQAYDDDDDYYYYSARPRVYYRPTPGYLPGTRETTHDRTGSLPGVTPRYPQGYGYNYDSDYYARPSTCGRYHYWNGSYCSDARWRPPFKRHYPIYRYVYIYDYD